LIYQKEENEGVKNQMERRELHGDIPNRVENEVEIYQTERGE
jgi:hypothetical protein